MTNAGRDGLTYTGILIALFLLTLLVLNLFPNAVNCPHPSAPTKWIHTDKGACVVLNKNLYCEKP